jgi:hypothetical protein
MPWIHATLSGSAGPVEDLARDLASAAAGAAGLDPSDVVALVTVATAAAGSGALVTIAGRPRDPSTEAGIATAVRQVVATATGVGANLVAVVRS